MKKNKIKHQKKVNKKMKQKKVNKFLTSKIEEEMKSYGDVRKKQ